MSVNTTTSAWPIETLSNEKYFKLIMGQSPPGSTYNESGNGLPFFQGKADFGEETPTPRVFCTAPTRIAEPGDILISVRAPVGPTNVADRRCAIGRGLAAIRCKESVAPRYLLTILRALEADIAHLANGQGGGFTCLRKEQLAEFEIPIPPLEEQKQLIKRIGTLTSRIEKARQARKDALAEAETAQAALVDAVFAKRNTDWDEATVKQLCGQPQYGYTESASYEQIGPRFLRITDIQNGAVNWETVPFCDCDEISKYRLASGDIVFARTGATTGKSYLVKNPPEAVFASYLIRIRPGERVLPEYIWWYFQSSSYWRSVFGGIDDGNRPNMNGSKLAALCIPFPNEKNEQRRIVAQLDALAVKQSKLRQLQLETENEFSAFTPALLSKIFRGGL